MADVSHTSAGYTGTVDQVAEAARFTLATLPFRVNSSTDWAVTVNSGANLTVNIAAGQGMACGVRDATTSTATLAAASNASGTTRLDVIVASFNWTTGATTFGIVQGTTSLPPINTGGSVVSTSVNRIPGVQYDAVLAVLQVRSGVGVLSTTDLFDSRAWGGVGGSGVIPTATYLSMVDARHGTELHASDTKQRWRYDGSSWSWPRTPQGLLAYVAYSPATAQTLASTFNVLSAFPAPSLTIPANRRIRVTFRGQVISPDATHTVYYFTYYMNKGSGGPIGGFNVEMPLQSVEYPFHNSVTVSPAAGTWNFQIGGQRASAGGSTQMLTDGPNEFYVEDLGAAS